MKLKTAETPIVSGGDLKMKGFQIAASAKAFRILSSNLYKNKIRAIIRELSCNAVDGHIAGKNDGPFDVTLPGQLDPQFKIRDYGCGMDDDTIMNLYTTYFASTKSDSNDYIGALGLGSKSPFSYTDSFVVVSYFEGMRRMYSAFIKDGEPTITKVSETETKEPNGIEITVPVNPADIPRWRDEAKYVFTSFGKIRPNIRGSVVVDYLPADKTEFTQKNTVHGAGVFAIMGNIAYPLPAEYWQNTMINLSMKDQRSWSYRDTMTYYIRFELGELDITPSREELSLDDETIENLKKRVKETDIRMSQGLIDEVKTYKSVRKLHKHIHSKYNSSYWQHIAGNKQYVMENGQTVANEASKRTNFEAPSSKVSDANGRVVTVEHYPSYYDMSQTSPRQRKLDSWSCRNIAQYGNDKVYLFVNDMKTGHLRTMQGLKTLGKIHRGRVYFVQADDAPALIKQMQECWIDDELEIFYSSKCDDARKAMPTKPKAASVKAPNTVMVNQTSETPIGLYADDIKGLSGYWIPMFNGEYVSTKNRNRDLCSLSTVRWFMKHKGIKEIPVIKSSQWERVAKNPAMKEIWEDLLETAVQMAPKMTQDIFPFDNSTNSYITTLNRHSDTKFIADKLLAKNSAHDLHRYFYDIYNNIRSFSGLDAYAKHKTVIEKMLTDFSEMTKIANKKGQDALDKFMKENQLITYYLQRTYGGMSNDVAKEIASIVKL